MKIAIFGSSGQIGFEVTNQLQKLRFKLLVPDRSQVDLLIPGMARDFLLREKPNVIINATGYNSVDLAEIEQDKAMRINSSAVGEMANCANKLNALFVHYQYLRQK